MMTYATAEPTTTGPRYGGRPWSGGRSITRLARSSPNYTRLVAEPGKPAGFDVVRLASTKRGTGQGELAQIMQYDLCETVGRSQDRQRLGRAVLRGAEPERAFDVMVHSYSQANKDSVTLLTGAIAWFPKGIWTRIDNPVYAELIEKAGSLVDRE